jgi:hypothetical protein
MLSCTDLEEQPVGLLAPEGFFASPKDVQAAIFSGYGRLSSENLYGRQYNLGLMYRGDMLDIGDPGTAAERHQVNSFIMDANNGMVRRWWPEFYNIVSAQNSAIFGVQQITADEAVKNTLLGEARFLRAFAYFNLVRLFGDIPYIEEFVTDPDAVKAINKMPENEVYQKIIADLMFAKENLPDKHPGDVRSRATKGTAAAYLASVYLTIGNYQKAAEEAKWVIANKNLFNYGLAPDFQDLFNAEKVSGLNEPLFVIDFLAQFRASDGTNYDQLGKTIAVNRASAANGGTAAAYRGFAAAVPSLKVYQSWSGNDYRKTVSLDTIVDFVNGTKKPYPQWYVGRPHCAKWCRYPGPNTNLGADTDQDYILMRYAEVLLIAAEAVGEVNGPTSEAMGYVNEVRARARNRAGTMTNFPADVQAGLSKQEFIDLVLEERRIELAFEWGRWFDIKRRKLGDKVFKGPDSLEPHANFDSNRDYLFPIPLAEIERYTNLMPQNPGY